MLRSYKYRLYPTKQQKVLLAKTFGCCRYIYNWGLATKMLAYGKDKKSVSVFSLDKEISKMKEVEETKWLKEVNSQSLQQSLRHLDAAYTRFFRDKKSFPKFKNKSSRNSFCNPQNTKIVENKLIIPKFKKGIPIIIHRELIGKICSSTISKTPSGKYFTSILVEDSKTEPKLNNPNEERTLGIDLGLTNYLTDSNGNTVENPRHLKRKLKKLKRMQRKMSRKKLGSKNRDKQRKKVAICHEKVVNCRKDFLHKLTKKLVENQDYDSIAMEDLDVAGMLQSKKNKLSRHIADAAWGEFKTLLTYKCQWYGKNLLTIGRFDPSSKLCPCGTLASLTLADRIWTCKSCGTTHKRDELAAKNIRRFAFCKQNTKKDNLVRREPPELFTSRKISKNKPLETCVSGSLKKEASTALA